MVGGPRFDRGRHSPSSYVHEDRPVTLARARIERNPESEGHRQCVIHAPGCIVDEIASSAILA